MVKQINDAFNDFDSHARQTLGESVGSQQHGRPNDVRSERLAGTAAQGAKKVLLMEAQFMTRDKESYVSAKSSVDAIDDLSGCKFFF
jgi:hypothetical protein